MFSFAKSLLVGAVLCVASIGWSFPQTLKVCQPTLKRSVEFSIADKTVSVTLSGMNSQGQAVQSQSKLDLVAAAIATPKDFDEDTLKSMHSAAEITSFTNVVYMQTNEGTEERILWFFEFEAGQYSAVIQIGGVPIPLGKTNSCN